jgi:hypothetical protein
MSIRKVCHDFKVEVCLTRRDGFVLNVCAGRVLGEPDQHGVHVQFLVALRYFRLVCDLRTSDAYTEPERIASRTIASRFPRPDGLPPRTGRASRCLGPCAPISTVPTTLLTYTRSIFEHAEGEQDILRLLVGRLPSSTSASSSAQSQAGLPLSAHYARALAELARQRGFDGYLLNVEVPLAGGPAQARLLAAWIALLREELRVRVGAHAEAIWCVCAWSEMGWGGR